MAGEKTLILSNVDVGDDIFESTSHGHWNVTRAMRDCLAGQHRSFVFDVEMVMRAVTDTEFDSAKVDAMVGDPARLALQTPPIFVVLDGVTWLIDGAHRIRALSSLGVPFAVGYAIEQAKSARYRVLYNGEAYPPWKGSK